MKLLIFISLSLIICLILNTKVLYFNIFTYSLPSGIYLKVNKSPAIGEYAASCLTQEIANYGLARGYLGKGDCSTGIAPVMKIIEGLPDSWYVNKNREFRVEVNTQQQYILRSLDSQNRPLKIFYNSNSGTAKMGNYVLLSDHVPNSWDSRYWGPVPISFILEPLITW